MPNIFTIVGKAWDFLKKHPVLNHVTFWLVALPMAGVFSLEQLQQTHPAFAEGAVFAHHSLLILGVIFAQLALSILMIWGTACILLISKKLIGNSAGRKRSSFKNVSKEAGGYVANLFLTGILRGCITLLWGLLFIVPGVMYAIRTYFYNIAIVCEEKEFRGALQQSKDIVTGNTWQTFLCLCGLAFVLLGPIAIISGIFIGTVERIDSRLLISANLIAGGFWGIATVVFVISNVILYDILKRLPKNIQPTPTA